MIEDFEKVKEQLKELAPIINSFASESVQLKVVEMLLSRSLSTHVAPVDAQQGEETKVKQPRRRSRRKSASKPNGSVTEETADQDQQPEQTKKRAARPGTGPQALVIGLLAEGFFRSPQTIGSIISHCGTSRGHHFKSNEISPPLLKLLRDKKLTRAKNSENQYEYTEA
jgi:hypothetical protein